MLIARSDRASATSAVTPTWVFEDESWKCQTECDNGQYDQHTAGGILGHGLARILGRSVKLGTR